MFIVLLRFSQNRSKAPALLAAHKEWINQGFEEGLFVLVGSLEPAVGGGILARHTSRAELLQFVNRDPFVVADVVKAEVLQLAVARSDPRLEFLLEERDA
jgi:uncharacterized protein YciI